MWRNCLVQGYKYHGEEIRTGTAFREIESPWFYLLSHDGMVWYGMVFIFRIQIQVQCTMRNMSFKNGWICPTQQVLTKYIAVYKRISVLLTEIMLTL